MPRGNDQRVRESSEHAAERRAELLHGSTRTTAAATRHHSRGPPSICGTFTAFLLFSMVDDVRRPLFGTDAGHESERGALSSLIASFISHLGDTPARASAFSSRPK